MQQYQSGDGLWSRILAAIQAISSSASTLAAGSSRDIYSGTFLVRKITSTSSYTVPAGKKLVITSALIGTAAIDLRVNGDATISGYSSGGQSFGSRVLLPAGSVISVPTGTAETQYSTITGSLINA